MKSTETKMSKATAERIRSAMARSPGSKLFLYVNEDINGALFSDEVYVLCGEGRPHRHPPERLAGLVGQHYVMQEEVLFDDDRDQNANKEMTD